MQAIVKKVSALPTLPAIHQALSRIIENPRSTMSEVVDAVSSDKSTVSRVLRLVNSAAFGLNSRVETVSQAVVLIGMKELRNLVMATTVMAFFKESDPSLPMTPERLWEHSVGVGLATRLLGTEIGVPETECLYVGGLLHDIGKLFFLTQLTGAYQQVMIQARDEQIPLVKAERNLLGTDHAEIGASLAEHWHLPEYIRHVIRNHHRLLPEIPNRNIAALVNIADYWVRALDLGQPGDTRVMHPRPEAWEAVTIPPGTFEKLTPVLLREHKRTVLQLLGPGADQP